MVLSELPLTPNGKIDRKSAYIGYFKFYFWRRSFELPHFLSDAWSRNLLPSGLPKCLMSVDDVVFAFPAVLFDPQERESDRPVLGHSNVSILNPERCGL